METRSTEASWSVVSNGSSSVVLAGAAGAGRETAPSAPGRPPWGRSRSDLPYTNNACERALRPSVIFRKVTNGFRAEWGARVYAAAASVIATGRMHGRTALAGVAIIRPE